MRMLRNPEVLAILAVIVLLGAAAVAVSFWVSAAAAVIAALVGGYSLVFLGFTRWRYRELDRLAAYLVRVVEGDYDLDIRDNAEGELSILKSEIYKVTVMLTEQAAALRREKSFLADALSDISHQLKTPLTSMFVMTDLLCGELPEGKRVEFTGRLRSQLERIQWLLSCLLKLSKLDAGAVEFRCDSITPRWLFTAASEPLLIALELKEQRLLTDCSDFEFACDPNWTVEALVNVLKNCVEHTPAGGEIQLRAADNPLYTELTIADNGPGIDPGDLPFIFNRFYRGKNAGEDSIGIGLAMAKSIITAQAGNIEAYSDQMGSRFVLRFHK